MIIYIIILLAMDPYHKDVESFQELNPWWQSIIINDVEKRLRRHVNHANDTDFIILVHEARKLRKAMGWTSPNDTSDLLEMAIKKIKALDSRY